jgi:excisionase family DNA binding protein
MHDVIDASLTSEESAQASAAQRMIVAALDHSRAPHIALLPDGGELSDDAPVVAVPPKVLRLIAELLGQMSQRVPLAIVPMRYEMSTQEAAAHLNVSRPFVVKELEAGRIPFRKVGTHRRIEFSALLQYAQAQRTNSDALLSELAREAQELGLGY